MEGQVIGDKFDCAFSSRPLCTYLIRGRSIELTCRQRFSSRRRLNSSAGLRAAAGILRTSGMPQTLVSLAHCSFILLQVFRSSPTSAPFTDGLTPIKNKKQPSPHSPQHSSSSVTQSTKPSSNSNSNSTKSTLNGQNRPTPPQTVAGTTTFVSVRL